VILEALLFFFTACAVSPPARFHRLRALQVWILK